MPEIIESINFHLFLKCIFVKLDCERHNNTLSAISRKLKEAKFEILQLSSFF